MVHAIKKPIIKPKGHVLFSKPTEEYQYKHIIPWLVGKYSIYQLDKNIISVRIKTNEKEKNEAGSSKITLTLKSHFERLDAFIKQGKVNFLNDVMPTGGLELWMRKEEFIDDPNQIVLDPKFNNGNSINHQPDLPVLPFKDKDNKDNKENIFYLEHKIEFTNEIMSQLKKNGNYSAYFQIRPMLVSKIRQFAAK